MGRSDDNEGDGRTFRRSTAREGFGAELEEEVAAFMLGVAKERFRSRRFGEGSPEPVVGADMAGEESDFSLSQIKAEGGEDELSSGVENDEGEEQREGGTDATSAAGRNRQRMKHHGLIPTVSTDDDLSYELLRPVTRHLLTKLDTTLTVLHNARLAGIDYASESAGEEQDEARSGRTSRSPRKRKVRRSEESPAPEQPMSRKRDLHTPSEGETEREMRIRLARKYHRRIPRFSGDEGETTAAETTGSRTGGRRQKSAGAAKRTASTASSGKSDTDDVKRGKRLNDWALRDWSDVLGAAALAGFSPQVIARATQRCADLFGQGMEFNTVAEEPATHGKKKSKTRNYIPGGAVLPTSDEEEDDEAVSQSEVEQMRAVSRASSVILHSSSDEGGPGSGSRSRSRSTTRRSYSVAPAAARVFCPYPSCSGAINGFARRYNLKKHLVTVHGSDAAGLSEDEDRADEVHGAVHVDGFLKPIRAQKGWRAGDARKSTKRKTLRKAAAGRRGTPPPRFFYSDDGYRAEDSGEEAIKAKDEGDYI
jgi:hypothetical protein